jgi:hypothetical protein
VYFSLRDLESDSSCVQNLWKREMDWKRLLTCGKKKKPRRRV